MKLKEARSLWEKPEIIWMLEKVTGLNATELRLADENYELDPKATKMLLDMLEERRNNVPVQYILGNWEFFGLKMKCSKDVLIPRIDTEILVEEVISFLQLSRLGFEKTIALDLCTGTGCVGISVAPFCDHIVLADLSSQAIELAKENAALNGVTDRISFVLSDLFNNIEGHFGLITANPPYIPTNELSSLSEEVKKEPAMALDGGSDGLDFYRAIIPDAWEFLLPGGCLFLEVGHNQGKAVANIFHENGYKAVVMIKDLEARDRVVRGTRK